jgi:hypothetical protein
VNVPRKLSRFYGYLLGTVHDCDGLLIGEVVQSFADTDRDVDDWEVQWLRVKLPGPGHEETYVPATGGKNVYGKNGRLVEERVGFTLRQVLAAPRCRQLGPDDPPDEQEEADLYRHYMPPV